MTQYVVLVTASVGSSDVLQAFGPFMKVGEAFNFSNLAAGAIVLPMREPTRAGLNLMNSEFRGKE